MGKNILIRKRIKPPADVYMNFTGKFNKIKIRFQTNHLNLSKCIFTTQIFITSVLLVANKFKSMKEQVSVI